MAWTFVMTRAEFEDEHGEGVLSKQRGKLLYATGATSDSSYMHFSPPPTDSQERLRNQIEYFMAREAQVERDYDSWRLRTFEYGETMLRCPMSCPPLDPVAVAETKKAFEQELRMIQQTLQRLDAQLEEPEDVVQPVASWMNVYSDRTREAIEILKS